MKLFGYRLSEGWRPDLPAGSRPTGFVAHLAAGAASARPFRSSRTTAAYRVELPGIGPACVKVFRYPTRWDRLRGVGRTTALAPSRARREWEHLRRWEALGCPVPRPLGWVELRRRGWLRAAAVATAWLEGAVPLDRFWAAAPPPAREAAAREVLRWLLRLHRAGYVDWDFHPRNLLVVAAPSVRVYKVDSAAARRTERPRHRARDLACLEVWARRAAPQRLRLRFWRAYLRGLAKGGAGAPTLKEVLRLAGRLERKEGRRVTPCAL